MKKILSILLFIILFSLSLFSFIGAYLLNEARTILLVSGIFFAFLLLFIYVLRKIIIRKKVKSFIDRIIHQNRSVANVVPAAQRDEILALEKNWFTSIDKLNHSALRAQGDPLYILPWYLVIGESGTGKTSMMKHCGLSSPLSEMNSSPGLPITRNCDWWFFNEAIVLDTAGRYTIPLDQDRDSTECEQFLKHLAQFRKKEPVNGIVAAISSETLSKCSTEQIAIHAQQIRARIDQVMRMLGSSVPIYIMITKMDLVFGLPEFCRLLPQNRLGQPMGWCNNSNVPYSDDLIKKAMLTICDNLKKLQFGMLHTTSKPDAEILVFPQRFLELSTSITSFCSSLFSNSVYHVTPVFRGLYFSSASQKIAESETDPTEAPVSQSDAEGGLFLRDFFSKILPGDRSFNWYIPEYRKNISRIVKNTLIGSAAFFTIFTICVWLVYTKTSYTLKNIPFPVIQKNVTDHKSLESIRIAAREFEKHNHYIPGITFGFSQSIKVQKSLEDLYSRQFTDYFTANVMKASEKYIALLKPDTPIDSVTTTIQFITSTLALLQTSKPSHTDAARVIQSLGTVPFISQSFKLNKQELFDWIRWTDTLSISSVKKMGYSQLALLIQNKGTDLKWACGFNIHGVDSITAGTFWEFAGKNQGLKESVLIVNGAFTSAGSSKIRAFLSQIDTALSEPSANIHFKAKCNDFKRWYESEYISQWRMLSEEFVSQIDNSITTGNCNTLIRKLATGDDPFMRYVKFAAQQFDTSDMLHQVPAWSSQFVLLNDVDSYTTTIENRAKAKSFIRKLINKATATSDKVTNSISDVANENNTIRRNKIEQASSSYSAYRKSISELGVALGKPDALRIFAKGLFDKSDSSALPYTKLQTASDMLKLRLFSGAVDNAVSVILDGSLFVTSNAAYTVAMDYCNQLWLKNVYSKVVQLNRNTYADLLFAPDSGLARKFIGDPYVSAFIQTGTDGLIHSVNGINGPLPVSDQFLSFINNGLNYKPQKEYAITLQSTPFSVNNDATEEPHLIILRLQCGDGDAVLENYNNNEVSDFVYNPSSCGRVTLKIVFPSFIAVKTWDDELAFPQFLTDFKNGTVDLVPDDFDNIARKNLNRIGCRRIRVTYNFDTREAAEITKLIDYNSLQIPVNLTSSE